MIIINHNRPTDNIIFIYIIMLSYKYLDNKIKFLENKPVYLVTTFGICLAISYSIGYFFNYKKRNNKLQELILIAKDACYHIHHWMWMTLLVASMTIGRYISNDYIFIGIIGLWLGACLEDLLFSDWYIVYKNCHKNKLIKLLQHNNGVIDK